MDWVAKQKAMQNFVVSCTGLAADHVAWAQQQAPRPAQPGIVMRIMNDNDAGIPWINTENNPLVIPTLTITSVVGNVFNKTNHGLLTGDGGVNLASTLTLPTGISPSVNYWIVKVDDNSFKLASTFTNAMNNVTLTLSSAGSGVITLVSTSATLRAGQEVKLIQRSLIPMTLALECYTDIGVGMDMATSILWRVAAKRLLPSNFDILQSANIGVSEVGRVRSMNGTQGQYLFEPRAMVDISLYVVAEESENTGIIEHTVITDEVRAHTWTVDVKP